MSISTSVVETKAGYIDRVVTYLKGFEEVGLYGVSEDANKLLLVIDAEDEDMENLCDRIKECEGVIDLLHHSFYFEDK